MSHFNEDNLRALLVEYLGVKPEAVTSDANLVDDLGVDSLDVVGIAMRLEDAYGIDVDEGELDTVFTVSDLVAHITKKLKNLG